MRSVLFPIGFQLERRNEMTQHWPGQKKNTSIEKLLSNVFAADLNCTNEWNSNLTSAWIGWALSSQHIMGMNLVKKWTWCMAASYSRIRCVYFDIFSAQSCRHCAKINDFGWVVDVAASIPIIIYTQRASSTHTHTHTHWSYVFFFLDVLVEPNKAFPC